MEKSYRVVGNTGHWAIAEDDAEPAGDYATREGALEAIYLATSNDIKKGRGVTIRIDPPRPMPPKEGRRSAARVPSSLAHAPATGGKPYRYHGRCFCKLTCSAIERNAASAAS